MPKVLQKTYEGPDLTWSNPPKNRPVCLNNNSTSSNSRLVGRQEGHLAHKKLNVGLLVVTFAWSFERLIDPVVATTYIILSTNKTG